MHILPEFDFLHLEQNSLEDLRDMRKHIGEALTGPHFGVIMRVVNGALPARINRLIAPARDIEGVLSGEFEKGYYAGMSSIYTLITGKLAEIQSVIEAKEAQQ